MSGHRGKSIEPTPAWKLQRIRELRITEPDLTADAVAERLGMSEMLVRAWAARMGLPRFGFNTDGLFALTARAKKQSAKRRKTA